MVEASPASSLVVPEPDLLVEVLMIPLDAPAQFGKIDQSARDMSSGRVENQYLVGSASPSGQARVGMADDARQTLDIGLRARFTL